jgi:hypothetical protein
MKNMATAADPIVKKVIHKIIFESTPLLFSPMIFSLDDIFIMRKMSGTAAMPFKTAEYTSAFTGFIPTKFIIKPIIVAMVMMP